MGGVKGLLGGVTRPDKAPVERFQRGRGWGAARVKEGTGSCASLSEVLFL